MNPKIILGVFFINLALLSYGMGSISLHRFRMIGRSVLFFIALGIVLNIAATTLMMLGSDGGSGTFLIHYLMGYSGFVVMLVDFILIWKVQRKKGMNATVNKNLHLYSGIAYTWWVGSYITGSLLVFF